VALTTESAVAALGASAGITFRPVPGVDPLDFSVAHRAGDDRQTVLDFVRAALDMDVSLPWAPPAANGAGGG
jgi:hypothetical protein